MAPKPERALRFSNRSLAASLVLMMAALTAAVPVASAQAVARDDGEPVQKEVQAGSQTNRPEADPSMSAAEAAAEAAADAAAAAADAAVAAAGAECREEVLYVSAPSLGMHAAADASSPLRAVLPIGTRLQMHCRAEGGWRHGWAHDVGGLSGWMRGDQLSLTKPTADSLRRILDALPEDNLVQRRTMAERWVAIAPTSVPAHEAMIAVLERSGELEAMPDWQARLQALRNPQVERAADEPHWLFIVDAGSISPIAIVAASGIANRVDAQPEREAEGQTAAQPSHFRVARPFHYYTRGGSDGMVRVLRREAPSCESEVAAVEHVSAAPRDAATLFGIASNAPLSARATQQLPSITAEEQELLERYLQQTLSKQGFSHARFEQAKLDAIAHESPFIEAHVAQQHRDSGRLLIATLSYMRYPSSDVVAGVASARTGYTQITAEVILEVGADGQPKLTHSRAAVTDVEQHTETLRYIDYMDIDGDGSTELLFSGAGDETWWYEIWTRDGAGWRTVATGDGGC